MIRFATVILAGLVGAFLRAAEEPAPQAPLPPSPVEEFRNWLVMPAEKLDLALADRPSEKRGVLLRKVNYYKALGYEERERRLQLVELRWYLSPLLAASSEERGRQIRFVPERYQSVVKTRLDHWEMLPPEFQRQVLETELGMQYLILLPQPKAGPVIVPLPSEPPFSAQIQQIFALAPDHRVRMLSTFPDAERSEIQRTLDIFAQLPPELRRACIESFDRLARMSVAERREFLRNAERWQALSPVERTTWKTLVDSLPPWPTSQGDAPVPPVPMATNVSLER